MDADNSLIRRDLFSKLNRDIIDIILTKLPTKDAVTTCVLSRFWRDKWTSMPHVSFHDRISENPGQEDENSVPFDDRMIRFIEGFLSMHRGNIQKLHWQTEYASDNLDAHRWLADVFRRGDDRPPLKELTINFRTGNVFAVPPCLFSCVGLKNLTLSFCSVEIPQGFEGFPCMKSIDFMEVAISDDDLSNLVSNCPILEKLKIEDFVAPVLEFRATNLKCLNLFGYFINLNVEISPSILVDVKLESGDWFTDEDLRLRCASIRKFIRRIDRLEKLSGDLTKTLSAGGRNSSIFRNFESLEKIDLFEVSFDDPREVLSALHLIFSAPNLKELYIHGVSEAEYDIEHPMDEIDGDEFLENRTLEKLQVVEIGGQPYMFLGAKLIELLLGRSPSLVKMTIDELEPSDYFLGEEISQRDYLSFHRASQNASIVVFDLTEELI